jgi:prepilin-type N-terminal cleavage/methylation domain-containing protein
MSLLAARTVALRRRAWLPRGRGAGLTLVEIMIVISIIGILAALGGPMMTIGLPRWRARRAAMEFASTVAQARALAIADNVEYRIQLEAFDPDLSDATSVGRYSIARGNAANGSTAWDVLPVEPAGSTGDSSTGGGTVEISDGGEDALADISIDNWGTLTGSTGDDIVFSPRGWVGNPTSDFNADGYIDVTFVNTAILRSEGVSQTWTVRIGRGGMTRVESNLSPEVVDGPTGTGRAGTLSATSGSGFNP